MIDRDGEHWETEGYRQRMPLRDWQQICLRGEDSVIFHGKLRRLVGKRVCPGVYEIHKEPLDE